MQNGTEGSSTKPIKTHPKVDKLLNNVATRLKEVQAQKTTHQHEEEERIREDERQKAKIKEQEEQLRQQVLLMRQQEQQRKEAERQKYIECARVLKATKSYPEAIAQYELALKVQVNDRKEPSLLAVALRAVSELQYDLRDSKIAEIFCEIAECYTLKRDYVAAYGYLKQLNFTGCPITDIKIKIDACAKEIRVQATSIIVEAEKILSIEKLEEARVLAETIQSKSISEAIKAAKAKITWQQKKPEFIAAYALLIKTKLDSNLDYDHLAGELKTWIGFYDKYSNRPSLEEAQYRSELAGLLDTVNTEITQRKLKREWLNIQASVNAKYQQIVEMDSKYEPGDLQRIVDDLSDCVGRYSKHFNFLSDDEKGYKKIAADLLSVAKQQLQLQINKERRAADKLQNVVIEQDIQALLQQAHGVLCAGKMQECLGKLLEARSKAASITHVDDIEEKKFKQHNYFDASIEKLQAEIRLYNQTKEDLPESYIREMIDAALKKCKLEANKELLERHLKRLVINVSTEFEVHWPKLYCKQKSELETLFDEIANMISVDLELLRCKKWYPHNWTYAGFGLHSSQTLHKDICSKIREFASGLPMLYVQLAVFVGYTYDPDVPTAKIYTGGVVPSAPTKQELMMT